MVERDGDLNNKGRASLAQPEADTQAESAGSGEQACRSSLQPAASSIKSAAGTEPHPAAISDPPSDAAHFNAQGQAAAGPAVGRALAASPYHCDPLPIRGHLMLGHGLLPREYYCYEAVINAYIQQELWLPLEKRSPALGGRRRLDRPPPPVPLSDVLEILVAKDAKKRAREWRTACRDSAAWALGYQLDEPVDVPTLLRNLAADPPVADGLHPFVVPASDPRVGLRGARGLRATRSFPPGAFLGFYRGTAYFKAAYDKMLNDITGGSRYRRKRDFDSYGADFSLKEVAGAAKDSRLPQLPDLKWAEVCGPHFNPSTDGTLVISALEGMNQLGLVNDPNTDPASHQGYNEHAGNCHLFPLLIGPVPFLALFTTKQVLPGQELTYCYGEGYWDALRARQADADHEERQERELDSLRALARRQAQQGPRGGEGSFVSEGRSVSVEMPATAGAADMLPQLPQQQQLQRQIDLSKQQRQQRQHHGLQAEVGEQQQQQQAEQQGLGLAARQPRQPHGSPSAPPIRSPPRAAREPLQRPSTVPFPPGNVGVPRGGTAQAPLSPAAVAGAAAAAVVPVPAAAPHHATSPPPSLPPAGTGGGTIGATPPSSLPNPGSALPSAGTSGGGGGTAKRFRKISPRTINLIANMKRRLALEALQQQQRQQQQQQQGATCGLQGSGTPPTTAAAAVAAAAATTRHLNFDGAGHAGGIGAVNPGAAAAIAGLAAGTAAAAAVAAGPVGRAAHQPTSVRPMPQAGDTKPRRPAVGAVPLSSLAAPVVLSSPKAATRLVAAEEAPPLSAQPAAAAAVARPKPVGGRGGGKGSTGKGGTGKDGTGEGGTGKAIASPTSPPKLPTSQRTLLDFWPASPGTKPAGGGKTAEQAQHAAGVVSPVARRPQPGEQLPFPLPGSKPPPPPSTAAAAPPPPLAAAAPVAAAGHIVAPPPPAATAAAPGAAGAATAAAPPRAGQPAGSPGSKPNGGKRKRDSRRRIGREVVYLRARGDGSLDRVQGIVVEEGRNRSGVRWVGVELQGMTGQLVLAQDKHYKSSPLKLQAAQDWAFLRSPGHAHAPAPPSSCIPEAQPPAQAAARDAGAGAAAAGIAVGAAAAGTAVGAAVRTDPAGGFPQETPPKRRQAEGGTTPGVLYAGVPVVPVAAPLQNDPQPLSPRLAAEHAQQQQQHPRHRVPGQETPSPQASPSCEPAAHVPSLPQAQQGNASTTPPSAGMPGSAGTASLQLHTAAGAAQALAQAARGKQSRKGKAPGRLRSTPPVQQAPAALGDGAVGKRAGESISLVKQEQHQQELPPSKRSPVQQQEQQRASKRARLQPGQQRGAEPRRTPSVQQQALTCLQGQQGQQPPRGAELALAQAQREDGREETAKQPNKHRQRHTGAAAAASGDSPVQGDGKVASQLPPAGAEMVDTNCAAGAAGPPPPSDQQQERVVDLTWIHCPPAAAVPPCTDGDIIDLTLDDD
ncbi:hypothetical protein N2152v2_009701 [Parachlorella kessleri]